MLAAFNPAVNQADNSSQLHLIIRRAFVLLNNTNDNGNNNLKMNAICGALTLCRTRLSDFALTFRFHALEKEMATHSNVLAWRIPGMGEPGGLPSMGSHRVGHDWSDLVAAAAAATLCHFVGGQAFSMHDLI